MQIELFPNPFSSQTTILVSKEPYVEGDRDKEKFNYILYSIQGQAVEKGVGNFDQELNLGKELPKGIYVLELFVQKEKQTVKMVKN